LKITVNNRSDGDMFSCVIFSIKFPYVSTCEDKIIKTYDEVHKDYPNDKGKLLEDWRPMSFLAKETLTVGVIRQDQKLTDDNLEALLETFRDLMSFFVRTDRADLIYMPRGDVINKGNNVQSKDGDITGSYFIQTMEEVMYDYNLVLNPDPTKYPGELMKRDWSARCGYQVCTQLPSDYYCATRNNIILKYGRKKFMCTNPSALVVISNASDTFAPLGRKMAIDATVSTRDENIPSLAKRKFLTFTVPEYGEYQMTRHIEDYSGPQEHIESEQWKNCFTLIKDDPSAIPITSPRARNESPLQARNETEHYMSRVNYNVHPVDYELRPMGETVLQEYSFDKIWKTPDTAPDAQEYSLPLAFWITLISLANKRPKSKIKRASKAKAEPTSSSSRTSGQSASSS
jgi:hypothetical protein